MSKLKPKDQIYVCSKDLKIPVFNRECNGYNYLLLLKNKEYIIYSYNEKTINVRGNCIQKETGILYKDQILFVHRNDFYSHFTSKVKYNLNILIEDLPE